MCFAIYFVYIHIKTHENLYLGYFVECFDRQLSLKIFYKTHVFMCFGKYFIHLFLKTHENLYLGSFGECFIDSFL